MAMAKAYLNETSGDEEDMRRTIRRLIQENSSLMGENAELSSQVNVSQDWIMRQSSFLGKTHIDRRDTGRQLMALY